MMNDFEIKGNWWLPEQPDVKIPGILKFVSTTSINIELHGCLSHAKSTELITMSIIHGQSGEGKDITLYDCFETNCGAESSSIVANHVFIGKLFNKPEDIKFSSIRVSYEHLV